MGTFTHPITLVGSSVTVSDTMEGLVDTAATFTSVPEEALEKLGARPQWRIRLELADGQTVERGMGEVVAEIDGERRPILCACSTPMTLPP